METGKTDKDTIYSNMQRYAPSRERTDVKKTEQTKRPGSTLSNAVLYTIFCSPFFVSILALRPFSSYHVGSSSAVVDLSAIPSSACRQGNFPRLAKVSLPRGVFWPFPGRQTQKERRTLYPTVTKQPQ
jgi:hypothetical protein